MRLRLGTLTTLSVAVLASGCSGGGQSSAPVVPSVGKIKSAPAHGSTKARLTIKMPIRKTGTTAKSSRVKPQYVSNGTAGLGIRAGSSDPTAPDAVKNATWQLFDVSANSSLCSTTGDVRTCVISVIAPLDASDEFQIDATDKAPLTTDTEPTGNILSSGDTTTTVTVGAANPVAVSLTGVIGLLSTDKAVYNVWAAPGAPASTVALSITANDYANGMISGNPAAFQNPIAFSDGLGASSPFTYPSATVAPPYLGLPPPATPGAIPTSISYVAPLTGTAVAATVTVNTIVPDYLSLPNGGPSMTFAIDPMVVSVGGSPVGSISNLMAGGPDVPVLVTETGATLFNVTANDVGHFVLLDAQGNPLVNPIEAHNGAATFIVRPLVATSAPAPLISVADSVTPANATVATLPAPVGAATPSPAP